MSTYSKVRVTTYTVVSLQRLETRNKGLVTKNGCIVVYIAKNIFFLYKIPRKLFFLVEAT